MAMRLISSDSHINEPPDLWTKAAPGAFRDRVPRVVSVDAGDAWVVSPDARPRAVGTSAVAGVKPEDYFKKPVTYKEMRPGSYDPVARIEDMEIDHLDAEVLYPGIGRGIDQFADAETRLFCAQVYNDWIAEFQAADPARLVGLAILPPLDDGPNARKELERVVSLGLRGAFLARTPGGRPLTHPEGDDLWACANEHRIPMSLHIGHGLNRVLDPSNAALPGMREAYLCTTPLNIADEIAVLLFSGLLERFPDLRVVIAESGIGWVPGFLARCENVYDRHRHYLATQVTRRPTEAWKAQMRVTFGEDLAGIRLRDLLGVETMMWASDYPHTDTTWPESTRVVARDFAEVPDDEVQAIVAGNCADLYALAEQRG
jgi:predicted TIM-barrel fold metal-dependent hydrolase